MGEIAHASFNHGHHTKAEGATTAGRKEEAMLRHAGFREEPSEFDPRTIPTVTHKEDPGQPLDEMGAVRIRRKADKDSQSGSDKKAA